MLFKILIVSITVVTARNIISEIDTDNSDAFNKQAKLDFETTTNIGTIIPPPQDSHESETGPYNVDIKNDNPAISANANPTSNHFHTHVNPSDHKLHEFSSFQGHQISQGHDLDDAFYTNKGSSGLDKEIEDIFKENAHSNDETMRNFGEHISFGIELENSQNKDQINDNFPAFNNSFSSITTQMFGFKDKNDSESKNTFNEKLSQGFQRDNSESSNFQNRDEREQHNLRNLHQQRNIKNGYLDSLLSENKRRFESETKNRRQEIPENYQNIGYKNQHEGRRTNHFERRDVEEENNSREHNEKRRETESDDRRRHHSEMANSNRKTDDSEYDDRRNRDRQNEHEVHRTMQNSNKIHDNVNENVSHKNGKRNDESHNTQPSFDETYYGSDTNSSKTSFSIPVVSNTRNANKNKQAKESSHLIDKQLETQIKEFPNAKNMNAENDQRQRKATSENEDSNTRLKEKTDDGGKDRWIWSGDGEKMNNTQNGEVKVKNTTVGPDLDDRAAFNGDKCPSGKAKIGIICVDRD